MMSSENQGLRCSCRGNRSENDKVGLDWRGARRLRSARRRPAAQRLAAVLERRAGRSRASRAPRRSRRHDQLTLAVAALPLDATLKTLPDPADPLHTISSGCRSIWHVNWWVKSRRRIHLDHRSIDHEYGVSRAQPACAPDSCASSPSQAQVPDEVFAAYQACTAQPDAPVGNHRELGLLLSRRRQCARRDPSLRGLPEAGAERGRCSHHQVVHRGTACPTPGRVFPCRHGCDAAGHRGCRCRQEEGARAEAAAHRPRVGVLRRHPRSVARHRQARGLCRRELRGMDGRSGGMPRKSRQENGVPLT